MASNNDLFNLLLSIGGQMATKDDIGNLRTEVTLLRAENQAQRSQIRTLSSNVAVLRCEVESLRTKTLDELWEGIGEVKEDVARWGVNTQQEIWEGNREVETGMRNMKSEVERLVKWEAEKREEVEEVKDDVKEVLSSLEDVMEEVKGLSSRTLRIHRCVSKGSNMRPGVTCKLWFADGS